MAPATRRICFWGYVSVVLTLISFPLPCICLAQDNLDLHSDTPTASSTPPNNSSSTSSAAAQIHTITVGLADHKFKPELTNANIGDTIEFAFYPLNHSVVRAEYGFPCIPYEMTGQGRNGFFSGFKPVDSVLASPPTYSIDIKNTDPIFFYCSAVGSCINYGMVGVINPNMTTSVDEQHQLALDSSYMLNPGEPFPPETPQSSNAPTSPGTLGPNNDASKGRKALPAGAIAGIAIAVSCVVIIAVLLCYCWGRTKSLKDEVDRNAGTVRCQDSNNRNPLTMLETGHNHPTTIRGNGAGNVYQQYLQTPLLSPPMVDSAYQQYGYNQYSNAPGYSTPAPSYYYSQTPPPHPPPLPPLQPPSQPPSQPPPLSPPSSSQQEPQQQQNAFKYEISSATARTIPPIQPQPPLNIHHALSQRILDGAFELSPTGDQPGTLQNNHTNSPHMGNNANDPEIISPAPYHPHPTASPSHVLAAAATTTPTTTATTTTTNSNAEETIPSYFESVYRPGPKHINVGRLGPTEIDGKAVLGGVPSARTKWEQVGEKTVV